MAYKPSHLFNRPGPIPLKEYLEDIREMRKHGPWKLTLSWRDRFQLFLLSLIVRFSWYSDSIFINHPHAWSPAYTLILAVLGRKGFLDTITENHVPIRGLFSYQAIKEISRGNGKVYTQVAKGNDFDQITAFSKCLGELIERNISGFFDQNEAVLTEIPKKLLQQKIPVYYPPKFHRFLPEQLERHGEKRHYPDRPIQWVVGINLVTGEETYIPRQVAAYGAGLQGTEGIIVHPTSNGCAGYFKKEGAMLRGILEVVHRDGFLVHWLTQTVPERIRVQTLPEYLKSRIAEMKAVGISVTLLDVSSLGIPSVFAVAINEQSVNPQILLGGAAATSFEKAIEMAIEEIGVVAWRFESEPSVSDMEKIKEGPKPFVSSLDDSSRQVYWRGREQVEKFRWFLSGKEVPFIDLSQGDLPRGNDAIELEACLSVLKSLGREYCPIVYFPKHPLLEKIGYSVVKIVIPKVFPLYLREYMGTFDSDRLHEFARSKGKFEWKLNPEPHMFS